MISAAVINLGLVGLTCLFMIVYMVKFVFRYKSEYESNPLCTATVLFCLLITLLTAFVIPIDIFLVSFIKDHDGTLKPWATNQTLTMIDEGVYATYYSKYLSPNQNVNNQLGIELDLDHLIITQHSSNHYKLHHQQLSIQSWPS